LISADCKIDRKNRRRSLWVYQTVAWGWLQCEWTYSCECNVLY